jgi:pimeloyl-ACP methyl ester carboxylesterase
VVLAATGIAGIALAVSGCGLSVFFPTVEESTPTGEQVEAAFEAFYGQVIRWEDCGELQCATALAPIDWDAPADGEIELALIRSPATSDSLGSLLVNPGGPGVSGYDAVARSLDLTVTSELRERYDIVGFDPRGVGRSTAVDCYDDADLDRVIFGVPRAVRGTNSWLTAQNELTHAFGRACARESGALLGNVDTVSAARDLDMLRAALGETQLDYLGYSYGAYLGTVYAGTFPEKVGRLVLDGPIDPALGQHEIALAQAKGLEKALRSYLATCMPAATCPFPGTADDALTVIRELLEMLGKDPIPSTDGRSLSTDTLLIAIAAPLYDREAWPVLDQVFATVVAGQAEFALSVVDGYYGRTAEGAYTGNLVESMRAITCIDYPAQNNVEVMKEQARQLNDAAPYLGVFLTYGDLACLSWPHHPEEARAAIVASGAAPILVLGATNDPSTPYEWAVTVATQLESGILVTREGDGHTSFNKGNACVDATVEQYLVDGTVPPADVTCPP